MYGVNSNNIQVGGNGGIPPNSNNNVQNQQAVSQAPLHPRPFTSKVAEQRNAGHLERGVIFPPGSGQFFAVRSDALDQLPPVGQEIRLALNSADLPILLPTEHPAAQSNHSNGILLIRDDDAARAQQTARNWKAQTFTGHAGNRTMQQRLQSQRQSLPDPTVSSESYARAPQNGRPLFDTTQEPENIRASIKWLEKKHYSLGDEKNSPPSKLITAEPPTEKEANGGFKARELGARLSDDKIIALHTTPDGILLGCNDDLFRAYLDNSKLCPLAPDQIGAIGKITSPSFPMRSPRLEPRLVNIDARTATHLTYARTAIDLVKTLLPFGAGNQLKDLVRTGGESYFRADLAQNLVPFLSDEISSIAAAAIRWKSGYCTQQAALTFAILRSLPELKDAQIDWVRYPHHSHFMVVIRGDTPEHDVIVDPWVPFAVPGLPADATELHREMAQRPDPEKNPKISIWASKPAGELFAPLEIAEILRNWKKYGGEDLDLYKYHSQVCSGTPAKNLHTHLNKTKAPDRWDTLYSCNPNVRYQLEGKDGEPPMMLRFDMQRVAKNPED